jgi:ubiquinol-cytochrome c reductase cytochrome c subunit
MRRLLLAAGLAIVAALALTGSAAAQPPIVRPAEEGNLRGIELGRQLFAANCSSCHGGIGQGIFPPEGTHSANNVDGAGPPVVGTGRLAPDFYLRTGYMPLAHPDEQPERGRPSFDEREIRALVDYIASLGGGPPIPTPHPESASLSRGFTLFTEHCAGCHQAVARGGVVTGAKVPPLSHVTPVQIAEAVRIGPYLMPSFSKRAISDAELDSIIAYVQYAKHPDDRGGWAIAHLGPFPEGLVAWGIGSVVLVLLCVLIGERLKRR